MTLLLYCYNPAPEYDERRKESEEWLQKVEHYVRVVRQPCTQPRDYPNKIKQAWGKENLIILEQDVVPPPMPPVLTLQDMLIFIQEYELVAWRYLLHPQRDAAKSETYIVSLEVCSRNPTQSSTNIIIRPDTVSVNRINQVR